MGHVAILNEVIHINYRSITLVVAAPSLSVAALSAIRAGQNHQVMSLALSRPVKTNCLAFNPAASSVSNADRDQA